MLQLNKIMITGRLTRDPETKYLASGQALTNISLAVNRRFPDKSGQWKEETMFIDVETWGKTAERIAESMHKGQPVYVEGRLKQDTWEKDGQKQSKIRITAERVSSLDMGTRDGDAGDAGGEEGYSAPTGGPSQARQPAGGAQGAQRREPAQTGMPSDNLDFSNNSNVQDDIPF